MQIGLNPAAWCHCDIVTCLMLQQVGGFNEVVSQPEQQVNEQKALQKLL